VTPVYDSVPPQLPDLKSPALLIFSKTNGYREEPAIKGSNDALVAIANKRGWSSFVHGERRGHESRTAEALCRRDLGTTRAATC